MLVAEKTDKRQLNFSLSPELVTAFTELADSRVGPREKWMLAAIAVLKLLEMSPEELDRAIERVGNADLPGKNFDALIADAARLSRRRQVTRPVITHDHPRR